MPARGPGTGTGHGCPARGWRGLPGRWLFPLAEVAEVKFTPASEKRGLNLSHPTLPPTSELLATAPLAAQGSASIFRSDSLAEPPAAALARCGGCGMAAAGQVTLGWRRRMPALPLRAAPRETTASQIMLGWKGFWFTII